MIRLIDIRVVCLIFTFGITSGCNARKSTENAQQSPVTPVAPEIERRGYHAKDSLSVSPTPWEVSTFRMRDKRLFSFRANQPEAGTSDYFVRFLFFEETYDSIEDARHRLANLHLAAPDDPAEIKEKGSVMRSGFRVGTVVYFLQTDAIAFWDEMRRVAKELATASQGVELTH